MPRRKNPDSPRPRLPRAPIIRAEDERSALPPQPPAKRPRGRPKRGIAPGAPRLSPTPHPSEKPIARPQPELPEPQYFPPPHLARPMTPAVGPGDMPELFPSITDPKQRAFLAGFALHGIKSKAAADAGVDLRWHRVWLSRDVAYSTAFAEAEAVLADRLEDAVIARGVDGIEEPILFMGMPTGEYRRRYSDHLVSFALPFLRRDRYGKGGGETDQVSQAMQDMFALWESQPPETSLPAAPTTSIGAAGQDRPPWELHPSYEEVSMESEEPDDDEEEDEFKDEEPDDDESDLDDNEELDEEEPITSGEFLEELPVDQNPFGCPYGDGEEPSDYEL